MIINISITKSTLSWIESEDAHVITLMNPSLLNRQSRAMEIPNVTAEQLANHFTRKGLEVEVIYEDVITQAKLTYWKHVLVHGLNEKHSGNLADFIVEFGVPLRAGQIDALSKIVDAAFSINAAIMGAGKTLTTLLNSFYFHKKGIRTLTIIACPIACMAVYKDEIQKYRGNFEDFSIEEIYGNSIEEMKDKLIMATSDVLMVSLSSIEKLVPVLQDKISAFDGQVILVVEEGHNVKEVGSKRSIGAQMIAPLATRVIVNTGTPMPKGPTDIRGILSLVGIPQPVEHYEGGIPKKDFDLLKGVTFVRDEDDIPYGKLNIQHLDFMDLHELNSKMTVVVREELKSNKVVIFCNTNRGLQNVWNSFPDVPKTVLSGSFYVNDCANPDLMPGRDYQMQQNAIKQFNTDPRCRILIINYRVGSTGVNLQHSGARLAFFFEISNNGADFFQARYRIRRPYIFPKDGFVYYFARNKDIRKRHTEEKQFAKIANQQAILMDIKRQTRGNV